MLTFSQYQHDQILLHESDRFFSDLINHIQNKIEKHKIKKVINPNATEEQLLHYSKDPDANIRYLATVHKNTTPKILQNLIDDEYRSIRYAATRHPNISRELLHKASKHSDPAMRKFAKEHAMAAEYGIA